MKILIIEDELKVASFLKRGLEENDYNADIAYEGASGLQKAVEQEYDLVILDVNLPQLSGYEVCKKLRERKDIPVLMLTAMGTLENKVTGFDAGADDYLLKPFEFKELLVRIKALTKRSKIHRQSENVFVLADLVVDLDLKKVSRASANIDLTAKEFNLLEYFIRNQGKVLSRADIAEKVWNLSFDTGTNIIDVYINYLRRKIDKDYSPKLIHTLVGMGYIMKVDKE